MHFGLRPTYSIDWHDSGHGGWNEGSGNSRRYACSPSIEKCNVPEHPKIQVRPNDLVNKMWFIVTEKHIIAFVFECIF